MELGIVHCERFDFGWCCRSLLGAGKNNRFTKRATFGKRPSSYQTSLLISTPNHTSITLPSFPPSPVPSPQVKIDGWWNVVCDPERVLQTGALPSLFWGYLFAVSKYFELFDTVILILKAPGQGKGGIIIFFFFKFVCD